jgi:hypothetical protein
VSTERPIKYVGPSTIHDARIAAVHRSSDEVVVHLRTYDAGPLELRFHGVRDVIEREPVGIMLYSLNELPDAPPYRRFLFVNWEDDDARGLEIVARAFSAHPDQGSEAGP